MTLHARSSRPRYGRRTESLDGSSSITQRFSCSIELQSPSNRLEVDDLNFGQFKCPGFCINRLSKLTNLSVGRGKGVRPIIRVLSYFYSFLRVFYSAFFPSRALASLCRDNIRDRPIKALT